MRDIHRSDMKERALLLAHWYFTSRLEGFMRARLAILVAGAAALGGCAYGYGGYGSPYGGYGSPYGGLSVGVSSGYGGYGYGGYGGYGYNNCYSPYAPYGGYGSYYGGCNVGYDPFWGWNSGYYYPGTGNYVYDRYRRPHVWSDAQKRYWSERRERALKTGKVKENAIRDNWDSFKRTDRNRAVERSTVRERATDRQTVRQQAKETSRSTRAELREQRRIERETRKPD
jgi:hypothetical protein